MLSNKKRSLFVRLRINSGCVKSNSLATLLDIRTSLIVVLETHTNSFTLLQLRQRFSDENFLMGKPTES